MLECRAHLGSPRISILAAALLVIGVYLAMNVLRANSPAPSLKKPPVFSGSIRGLNQVVTSSSQVYTSTDLYSKDNHNDSVSSTNSRDDEIDGQILEAILARYRARVAIPTRRVVNPHNFKYVHNALAACTLKTVEIMIGVSSEINSFTRRNAIRQTWGEFATDSNNKAVILFFLGSTHDKIIQEKVNSEAKKHGDIIQETFVDSNKTLKSIALIKWASQFCQDSTYVVKTNDDMYMNLPLLISKLRVQFDKGPLFIMGRLLRGAIPVRIKGHKWYVSLSEYPHDRYPNYVVGTAYAMTTAAAMRLYVESVFVHPLHLDDVYLTGILADKASIPRVTNMEFWPMKIHTTNCSFINRISGQIKSPDDIKKIHIELSKSDLECDELLFR